MTFDEYIKKYGELYNETWEEMGYKFGDPIPSDANEKFKAIFREKMRNFRPNSQRKEREKMREEVHGFEYMQNKANPQRQKRDSKLRPYKSSDPEEFKRLINGGSKIIDKRSR